MPSARKIAFIGSHAHIDDTARARVAMNGAGNIGGLMDPAAGGANRRERYVGNPTARTGGAR